MEYIIKSIEYLNSLDQNVMRSLCEYSKEH